MTTNASPSAPVSRSRPPSQGRRWWVWLLALLGVALVFGLPLFFCISTWSLVARSSGVGGGVATRVYKEYVRGPRLGPEVAVLMLQGPIVSSRGGTQTVIAAQEVEDVLRMLNASSQVKAIVLYINSPGGGVAPSERIYHALQQVDKPVVAYFDDVAASGGYYIAMAAEEIVANPATLTGSIGVIAVFPYAEKLLDKIGIGFTIIKSGPAKDMGGFYRQMTPEERAHMQAIVDEMYARFVEVVAQGRDMDPEQVRAIADGRIYSAQQALDLGLVDVLGYEDDAIDRAAERAGLTQPPRVVRYYPGLSPLSLLFQARVGPPWDTLLQPGLYYLWLP